MLDGHPLGCLQTKAGFTVKTGLPGNSVMTAGLRRYSDRIAVVGGTGGMAAEFSIGSAQRRDPASTPFAFAGRTRR